MPSISLTSPGTAYTQNFNSLSNTAGSTANALPLDLSGWALLESGGGSRDNELYAVDNGSNTTGDIFSYGSPAATDRALGSLRSGSLIPVFGASFTNGTGNTITSLLIAYTGEQWRLGTASRTDRLDFQYSLNATSLSDGNWTDVDGLDFTSPSTTTTGAKDGNAAENKTNLSFTIGALSIPVGATVWIRWVDADATSADDGLAIDDFSLTPSIIPLVKPSVSLSVSSNAGTEAGTTVITVTATASEPVAGAQSVALAVSGVGITAGDYSLSASTITIANGATTGSVSFTVVDDAVFEGTETARLTISNPSDGITLGTTTQDIVITDNETKYFSLASGSFVQDWSDATLITADDQWAGVRYIEGFLGDIDASASTGIDPRLRTDAALGALDVIANQAGTGISNGGVAEFAIANPTVALQGSGTADAPSLVIYLDASGRSNVRLQFNARDVDGSADNAVQQLAVQYRIGEAGSWTNVTGGYIADATSIGAATQVTPVDVTLPPDANNQPQVQLRVLTTNAAGNDEWVGIDDIVVSSQSLGTSNPSVNLSVSPAAGSEAGTTVITVTATATAPVVGAQTVTLNVGGTGITAGDYTLSSTVITIADGATSGSVSFTVVDDGDIEPTETAQLSISDPSAGITLGIATRAIVITDNDTPAPRIHDIQGASHRSDMAGQSVAGVAGIVTALASNGFYLQDPLPDADTATSEAIFVFTSSAPTVAVGDAVLVSGTVAEFRPGNNVDSLTITELTGPVVQVQSSGNALPAAIVIGVDRMPPTEVIEDDAANVETGGVFDPASDGIDFWESLEGMRVQVNNPVATSPTIVSGTAEEIWVLADGGADATSRTERGGALVTASDFNPERIQLDDLINGSVTLPSVDVGARLSTVVGVIGYSASTYELLVASAPAVVEASPLPRETTLLAPGDAKLAIATFNVENLDPLDGDVKFNTLAARIVQNLRSPDILNLEEVQDNNGAAGGNVVDASLTLQMLIDAIEAAGGPTYQYRQINPAADTSGGEPGGNIRVAFLFNPARVSFVEGSLTQVDPGNAAWDSSRIPLVGDFLFNGEKVTLIGNHFTSKGGDDPLFGPTQPPVLASEAKRLLQADAVKTYVQGLLGGDPAAKVLVLGDLNDFEFSAPLTTLQSAGLTTLVETLPAAERYSYNFQGNAQTLDHIMASASLLSALDGVDVVHINSEFMDQVSDHDPLVARFRIEQALTLNGTSGRNALVGGPGNDIIAGLQGRDQLTGGDGADRFVYTGVLDLGDVITDFKPGTDRLVITQLLAAVGYGGTQPVDDGYLSIAADVQRSVVLFDLDGSAGPSAPRPLADLIGVVLADAHVLLNPNLFVPG